MADKTAELLMGADNPNRPEEKDVRLEEIRHLRLVRNELEGDNAELRCASRMLNQRLVSQAMAIEAEKHRSRRLETLLGQAKAYLFRAHSKNYPSHLKVNEVGVFGYRVGCAACDVLQAMERSPR